MDENTKSYEATKERFQNRQTRIAQALGYPETAEGKALLNECIPPLAAFITRELRRPTRTMLPRGLDVALRRLNAHSIALSGLVALLFSPAVFPIEDCEDEERRILTREKIGQAILGEWRGRRKARKEMKRRGNLARYQSSDWPREDIIHAGAWLEDCIVQALPDVFVHDEDGMPCILETAIDRARAIAHKLMLRDPVIFPRKNPPAPWSGFRNGGYWTPQSRLSVPFVRTHDPVVEHTIRDAMANDNGILRPHFDAVNAQQAVPWKIDGRMLDVVKTFGPYELPDNEKLFRLDMEIAENLKGEAFYIPKNCDWRGRFYGIPFFNFERQDWVRSIFKFHRGQEIRREGLVWLKIYTASTGDFDRISKRPFYERIAWVDQNLEKIHQAAGNPMETHAWWKQAGKKKQYRFLAACMELSEAVRVGTKFVSYLPISFDASASGIQHLCAMIRAEEGAEVNLTPSDIPGDVYRKVYDRVMDEIESRYPGSNPLFGRELLKSVVMTLFYNSSLYGTTDQMIHTREQARWPINRKALADLAKRTRSVTEQILPKSKEVMGFLGECAGKLAIKNKPLSWTSPSGMPVSVRSYIPSTKTIQFRISGKLRQHTIATGLTTKISKKGAVRSAAPSFVHSCDAAHMALVTNRAIAEGIVDVAMVHDSFGCPAAQASRFRKIIREEFIRLYEDNDSLAHVREAAERALGTDRGLPELPIRGTLDLNGINKFAFDC